MPDPPPLEEATRTPGAGRTSACRLLSRTRSPDVQRPGVESQGAGEPGEVRTRRVPSARSSAKISSTVHPFRQRPVAVGVETAVPDAGVHGALVLADDALGAPDEVSLREPSAVAGVDGAVDLGLGEPGPVEHQSRPGLHRRPDPGPDQAESHREGAAVPGSHARVEHLVERLDGAAVRHDVTGDDEVVRFQTPAHHLAQVDPCVCQVRQPHAVGRHGRSPLGAAVADAPTSLDAAAGRRADDIERDLVLEGTGERKSPELGGRDVGEHAVLGQCEGEGGRALPGRRGVAEAPHRLRLTPQPGQAPLVVAQAEPTRRAQGQRSRRERWELRRRHPPRVPNPGDGAARSSTAPDAAVQGGNTPTVCARKSACCLLSTSASRAGAARGGGGPGIPGIRIGSGGEQPRLDPSTPNDPGLPVDRARAVVSDHPAGPSAAGAGGRHRRWGHRHLGRLPPRPPRHHRRAGPRARPADVRHDVARGRPDDVLRLHERDEHPPPARLA